MSKESRKDRNNQGENGRGSKSDRLVIFDTTLRDGEQSPGASMTREEKIMSKCYLGDSGVMEMHLKFSFTFVNGV